MADKTYTQAELNAAQERACFELLDDIGDWIYDFITLCSNCDRYYADAAVKDGKCPHCDAPVE